MSSGTVMCSSTYLGQDRTFYKSRNSWPWWCTPFIPSGNRGSKSLWVQYLPSLHRSTRYTSKTLFKHNNYNKKTAGKGLQAITTAIRKGSRLLQNEEGNRALSATPGFSMIKTLTISHNHLVVLWTQHKLSRLENITEELKGRGERTHEERG